MKSSIKILLVTLFVLARAGNSTAQYKADTSYFEVDTVKSCIEWFCDSHNGTVILKSGKIKTVGNQIVAGNFVINMDSLQDKDITYELMRKTLHNTLKSEFFFDVKNYPTSTFVLDNAIPYGKNNYKISGDLWIKGLVNCIGFNAVITIAGNELTAVSEKFYIDRTRWGITIYSKQEAKSDDSVIVSDEIYFKIKIFAKRSKN
jgi:polyisoprenoid-binding protein YceI